MPHALTLLPTCILTPYGIVLSFGPLRSPVSGGPDSGSGARTVRPRKQNAFVYGFSYTGIALGIDNSIRIVVRAAAAGRRAPPQPLTRARGRDTRARYRVSARAEQGAQLGVALLAPLGAQPLAPVGAVPQRFLRAFSVMRTHQCAGRGRTESRAGRSKGYN